MRLLRYAAVGIAISSLAVGISSMFVAQSEPQSSEQPSVLSAAAPIFPAIAAAARATGNVVVEVKIDSSGAVSSAHTVEGHALLRKACETAAQRWKFAPIEDKSQTRTARLTFAFRILEKDVPEAEMTPVFMPPYKVEVTRIKQVIDTVTVQ